MAETTAPEPDPVGGGAAGGYAGRGGLSGAGAALLTKVKAKFSVDTTGIRSFRREVDELTKSLNNAAEALNKLGAGGGAAVVPGGTGQATGYQPGGNVTFSGQPANTGGPPTGLGIGAGWAGFMKFQLASSMVRGGVGAVENRIQRNMQESIPLSATDTLYQSMFGGDTSTYSKMRQMFGVYGGTRMDMGQAQAMGFRFGMGGPQFNRAVGLGVQASGGALTPQEAAGQYASFLQPQTQWRARGLGIGTAMQAGQPQVLGNIAVQYLRRFEGMFSRGRKLTQTELQESMQPGAPVRVAMKQFFALDDAAIDQVIQSGLQSTQYAQVSGGRQLDFGSSRQLGQIGLNARSSLALTATSLTTAGAGREEQFYRDQQGAMRTRLEIEQKLTEVAGDLEHEMRGLVSVFTRFGGVVSKVVDMATVLIGAQMLRGVLGGGGGGGFLGMGRGGTGVPGAPGGPGAPGVPGVGMGGLPRGMGLGMGLTAAGVGLGMASSAFGGQTTGPGGALGIMSGIATGAGIGAMLGTLIPIPGVSTGIGAIVGGTVGGTYAAVTGVSKRHAAEQAEARQKYTGMPFTELAKRFKAEWTRLEKDSGGAIKFDNNVPKMSSGANASDRIHGLADVWQERRAKTISSLLNELMQSPDVKLPGIDTYDDLSELLVFFESGSTKDDAWNSRYKKLRKVWDAINKSTGGAAVATRVLGTSKLADPYGLDPFPAEKDLYGGDPMGINGPVYGGDPNKPGGYGNTDGPGGGTPASDATFEQRANKMNPELKRRIKAMIMANPKVWLGTGWRSTAVQAAAYAKAPGRFAPPGKSLHEVGLAADMGPTGQFDWIVANAHRFGLATAVGWGEKWHVQIAGSVSSDPYTKFDPDWLVKIGGNPGGVNRGVQGNLGPNGGLGAGNVAGGPDGSALTSPAGAGGNATAPTAGATQGFTSNIGAAAGGIGYSLKSSVSAGSGFITGSIQPAVNPMLAGAGAAPLGQGPGGGGTGAVGITPGGAGGGGKQDPRTIYAYLRQQGVSPATAAGILANIQFESSFNPSVIGDRGTSGGLFQHHAGRWTGLKNYAASTNRDWTDWKAQVEFALQEAPRMGVNLQHTSPQQAAIEWALKFEKMSGGQTSANKRAAVAQNYMYGGDPPPAAGVTMHRLSGGGGGGGSGPGVVIHFAPSIHPQYHPSMTDSDVGRITDNIMAQLQTKVDAAAMRST